MQALMCHAWGPIDQLRVEEVLDPHPGPGQAVVDVHAASVNFPDALIVQGSYQVKPALPFSPGAELAGVVREVASDVTHVKPGDRVIAFPGYGAFAQRCLVEAARLMPLPVEMDFDTGASFMLTYGTSIHALRTIGKLQVGETLLVLGAAGGVGLAAIEIARAMGANVIAGASSDQRLELCRAHGAQTTINYSTEDLRARIDELTARRGVDMVYDPVGGSLAETALRATAWRGRYLVVGFAAGEIPKIALNLALLRERAILGVFWGDAMRREPALLKNDIKTLVGWFQEGKIRPDIQERVGLAGAADAIARMANRQVIGKVVVLPQS